MSQRGESIGSVEDILERYHQGYFPLYDWFGRFYWERPPERAVLQLDAATAQRAQRMGRRAGRGFTFARNTRFEDVLAHLRDPKIKPFTWVRPQVMEIYRRLQHGGFIHTVEAFNPGGTLVGAVLGVVLPNVLIAETMFMLEPEASKACLCRMVCDLYARGFVLIDVQTPHDRPVPPPGQNRGHRRQAATPHPCVRLGETCCTTSAFLKKVDSAAAAKVGGRFDVFVQTVKLVAQAHRAHRHRHRAEAAWRDAQDHFVALLQAEPAAVESLAVVAPDYPEAFVRELTSPAAAGMANRSAVLPVEV